MLAESLTVSVLSIKALILQQIIYFIDNVGFYSALFVQ